MIFGARSSIFDLLKCCSQHDMPYFTLLLKCYITLHSTQTCII